MKKEIKENKKSVDNYLIATYKYALQIVNTDRTISGYIEASDLLSAEMKLKKKYTFDPTTLKLEKQNEFTAADVFSENEFFRSNKDNRGNKKIKEVEEVKAKEAKLTQAIQEEAQSEEPPEISAEERAKKATVATKDMLSFLNSNFGRLMKLINTPDTSDGAPESKKNIHIDYKKILEYERRIKTLEEENKKNKMLKLSSAIEKKLDTLQKSLFNLQVKIEKGDFSKDDNKKINKLKNIIDEFEKRVHNVSGKIEESGDVVPTKIRRVSRKALNMVDELEESKRGNIPPHIKEKVLKIRADEERKYADKVAEQQKKIEQKIQFLHELLPDLDNEEEVIRIEKKIKLLEKKHGENTKDPILVKYYPNLADVEILKQFKGIEHTITLETVEEMKEAIRKGEKLDVLKTRDKKKKLPGDDKNLKDKKDSLLTRIQKYGVMGTMEQMRLEFRRNGGLQGAFGRMRDSMLGRKPIDILQTEGKKNKLDDVELNADQEKMKNRFNFKMSEESQRKKAEAQQKIVEGAKATGNIIVDFFNMLNDFLIDIGGVKVKERAVFYRLLAVMVSAGIPLIKCLNELVNQQENPKFKKVLFQLTKSIEQGASLSRGMQQFSDVFEESIIGMIKSGEASGTLPGILSRIAENIEKSAALTGKVKGAMMYPAVLAVVLSGVVVAILTLVLPKLMPLFMGNGIELPWTTKSLIFLSELLQTQGHFILLGGIVFVMAFKQFHKTYEGKFLVDLIILKVPVFGMLFTNMILARFSRTLSSLTASGLSIIKALKINADSIGNEVYKIEIMEIANKVKLGHTIGETLTGNKLFPSMLVNMIKVGEESAALGDVSERLAKFYEDETNDMVKNLTTLMEPIIITSLAGVVGFIMMAVMEPILALTDNVG